MSAYVSRRAKSTCTGRAEQEDAARGLDADGLEELRVAQRELDHLLDLRELLAAAADVVVAHLVQLLLLLLHPHPRVQLEQLPSPSTVRHHQQTRTLVHVMAARVRV